MSQRLRSNIDRFNFIFNFIFRMFSLRFHPVTSQIYKPKCYGSKSVGHFHFEEQLQADPGVNGRVLNLRIGQHRVLPVGHGGVLRYPHPEQ